MVSSEAERVPSCGMAKVERWDDLQRLSRFTGDVVNRREKRLARKRVSRRRTIVRSNSGGQPQTWEVDWVDKQRIVQLDSKT
jgi:hypothetical protein